MSQVSYYKYLGDPASCSAALNVLDQIEKFKIPNNAAKVKKHLERIIYV